jgi:uncharacterized protein (DUF2062 family)
MTAETAMARLARWVRNRIPTHAQLADKPFLRHLADRAELFRPTRRSVPRGVALGLFVGVMIPLAHFLVATVLAVFVRANIPAALLATFVGFPVIYVGLVALGYRIGNWLLHIDAATTIQPISQTMQATQAGHFLQQLTGAGIQTALGLFVIATVLASAGYLLTGLLWRWWIGAKRRRRLAGSLNPNPAE